MNRPLVSIASLTLSALLAAVPVLAAEQSVTMLSESEFPEAAPFPQDENYFDQNGVWDSEAYTAAWDLWNQEFEQRLTSCELISGLGETFNTSLYSVWFDKDIDENTVLSPVNIWMALAMLTECTSEATREELLQVLGTASLEELREDFSNLWTSLYANDGLTTILPSQSLWLNDDLTYNQETIDLLRDTYNSSVYSCLMGADEANQAYADWLDTSTGGLLHEEIEVLSDALKFTPDTVLALASALYFKAGFSSIFEEAATETETFTTPDGEVDCQMMHQQLHTTLYDGDGWTALCLYFINSGSIWLVLPDEGITASSLALDSTLQDLIAGKGPENVTEEFGNVNVSLPRFNVSCSEALVDILKKMGVESVFDPDTADFTALTDTDAYVSQILHAATVEANESGIEGAAFTAVMVETAAEILSEPLSITFDRPFYFSVNAGSCLFTGVVANPSEN